MEKSTAGPKKNQKFLDEIHKQQTKEFVETSVDDISMGLLKQLYNMAIKTESSVEKSIISSDMKIRGKISASGGLVLLGSVTGDIKCNSLSIEESGTLKGNIDAEVVSIAGKFDGQVLSEVVSIRSTGSVTGEVSYDNISIEEGAKIEAQLGKKKS